LDRTKKQVFLEQNFQIFYDLAAAGTRRMLASTHAKGTRQGYPFYDEYKYEDMMYGAAMNLP